MKNFIEKQIEARTGEILRQYTTFEGHLKNFMQQFHCYDLLRMCNKIYQLLQEKNEKKISWDDYGISIVSICKLKDFRKAQIAKPELFEEDERIDFDKTYNKIWPIISKPFERIEKEDIISMLNKIDNYEKDLSFFDFLGIQQEEINDIFKRVFANYKIEYCKNNKFNCTTFC